MCYSIQLVQGFISSAELLPIGSPLCRTAGISSANVYFVLARTDGLRDVPAKATVVSICHVGATL